MRLWASALLVGRRTGDVGNTFRAPGYARIDAGAVAAGWRGAGIIASIHNLLDKRYVEAIPDADNVYQGERRRVMLTLRQTW